MRTEIRRVRTSERIINYHVFSGTFWSNFLRPHFSPLMDPSSSGSGDSFSSTLIAGRDEFFRPLVTKASYSVSSRSHKDFFAWISVSLGRRSAILLNMLIVTNNMHAKFELLQETYFFTRRQATAHSLNIFMGLIV